MLVSLFQLYCRGIKTMTRAKGFINQYKRFFTGASIIAAIILSVIVLYIFVIIGLSQLQFDPDDYKTNLYTEVFGVLFSVFVSVVVIGGLAYWRERQQLRARLKREAGSRSNDIAIAAVEWLREKRWLVGEKGLLKGAKLAGANLASADLRHANLAKTDLLHANLQHAHLFEVNLQGAHLLNAKLQQAVLVNAELQGAYLFNADLQGAKLWRANLQGAILQGANLTGAELVMEGIADPIFRGVTLPDGTLYTEDSNMTKFTDPEHPEFEETRVLINVAGDQLLFDLLARGHLHLK